MLVDISAMDGTIARAPYLDDRGPLGSAYAPVSEFDDTVIEYVASDGGSNGALCWPIGSKKPGSML